MTGFLTWFLIAAVGLAAMAADAKFRAETKGVS